MKHLAWRFLSLNTFQQKWTRVPWELADFKFGPKQKMQNYPGSFYFIEKNKEVIKKQQLLRPYQKDPGGNLKGLPFAKDETICAHERRVTTMDWSISNI